MLQPFAERVQVDGSDGWQFIWRWPSTLHRRMESASKVQHVSVRIYTETRAASAWVVWYWRMNWTLWPASPYVTIKTFILTHHPGRPWILILHLFVGPDPLTSKMQVIQEHVTLLQDAQHQSLGQVKHLEGWALAAMEGGEGFWVKTIFLEWIAIRYDRVLFWLFSTAICT